MVGGLSSALSVPVLQNGIHIGSWGWDGTELAVEVSAALFGLGAIQLARDPDGVLSVIGASNAARRLSRCFVRPS